MSGDRARTLACLCPQSRRYRYIEAAAKGYAQLAPKLVAKLMQPRLQPATPPPGWEELTPREREIIRAIAQGKSKREIAQSLHIAEKT